MGLAETFQYATSSQGGVVRQLSPDGAGALQTVPLESSKPPELPEPTEPVQDGRAA